MEINMQPVAWVHNTRQGLKDDFWGDVVSDITLADYIPDEAFDGIETFSHLEILFYFDKVAPGNIVFSGHPRGNPEWPNTGIFAQRKKDRPNRIGLSTVELLAHDGRTITVRRLDAVDGTPILEIKPVYREFRPQREIRQPEWVAELMKDYWKQTPLD